MLNSKAMGYIKELLGFAIDDDNAVVIEHIECLVEMCNNDNNNIDSIKEIEELKKEYTKQIEDYKEQVVKLKSELDKYRNNKGVISLDDATVMKYKIEQLENDNSVLDGEIIGLRVSNRELSKQYREISNRYNILKTSRNITEWQDRMINETVRIKVEKEIARHKSSLIGNEVVSVQTKKKINTNDSLLKELVCMGLGSRVVGELVGINRGIAYNRIKQLNLNCVAASSGPKASKEIIRNNRDRLITLGIDSTIIDSILKR